MAADSGIHAACKAGDAAAVRRLLDTDPGAAWEQDGEQRLPLHWAACQGHEPVVRLLLDAVPAAATIADMRGWLPLHWAAFWGHEAVVRLLLEAAPVAAMADEGGMLPLHWAAHSGREAVVRLLLEVEPAAATAADGDGRTPLQGALRWGHTSAARALLGAGPAAAVLAALAAAGDDALPLFPDFLLAPGRLPLTAADWALVPSPCPGIKSALPAALASGTSQAAQVVQHMAPDSRERLCTAALCLSRRGLPGAVVAPILVRVM